MVKVYSGMSLNDLKILIKQSIKDITLEELYELSFYFNEEKTYLPQEYKKKYTESVLNVTINRLKLLKNDNASYTGFLDNTDVTKINKLLQHNDNVITYILNIIVIYTTYFLKEPIHLPGTVFPGKVNIYFDGKNYYCPVKKHHINNKKSLCNICIAKSNKEGDYVKN